MKNAENAGQDRPLRLRKLRFRAWHRGMRELDLLLGRFVDAESGSMSDREIGDFEGLLETPDRVVLAWLMGEEPVPADHDSPLIRRIMAWHGGVAS